MNLRTMPLRRLGSITVSASLLATSFAGIVAPTIAPAVATAATVCVEETGSTTVYPSLVDAQASYQGATNAGTQVWPNGLKLGCDVNLRATGSGSGKTELRSWLAGTSATERQVAASSSPLSSAEAADLMQFQVGGDAMVIAVRDDNPMTQITMAQVTAIYNGDITTWQQLGANAAGKTGTIVPFSRIPGSGTRDDMNRLFRVNRGTVNATSPYAKVNCKDNGGASNTDWTKCEPDVVAASGQARLTTSQEEADAVCNSANAIVYTSLANLALYGPGTAGCSATNKLKALSLAGGCNYPSTGAGGAQFDATTLTCSSTYVAPSKTTVLNGTYPAIRTLYLTTGLVSKLASKYGTGNGTGWTDNLGVTKAFDLVNYMVSNDGQSSVSSVGFVSQTVPSKARIPDADVDLNGGIGLTDIGQITGRWNRTDTIPGSIRADVDNNGGVGLSDIGKITGQWGATGFQYP